MKNVKQLLKVWADNAQSPLTHHHVQVQLRQIDLARIKALHEIFPGRTEDQLISELLSAALDEIEEALPYKQGEKIVAEDEFGDPIYEDSGYTGDFKTATRKYEQLLKQQSQNI